jgi:hypothetical protein
MSVLNPVIDSIDGVTRRIYLKSGVSNYFPIDDIYREYRNLRRLDEGLRRFEPLLRAEGNVPKGSGAFTPRYVVLINGTKIVPFNESLQLNQLGDMITDNPDVDATLYDISSLTVAKPIFIKPSEAEIIQLNSTQIEYASYNGGVTIDAVNGTDSAEYPYGTPLYPCKTTANSYAIRVARGFKKVYLRSDLSLVGIPDGVLNGLDIICEFGNRKYTLTINNVLVTDCKATNLSITGVFKAGSTAQAIDCYIHDTSNVNLRANNCSVSSGSYESTDLVNCILTGDINIVSGGKMSGVGIVFEGDFTTIDMLSSPSTVSMDIDSGYVKLINAVDNCLAEFNLRGGEIELDSTITGGDFYIEGYGTLYGDPTILGMTVKANNLISSDAISSSQIKVDELHKIQGLDPLNAMTVTTHSRTVADINLDITGNGETLTVVTRND